MAGILAPQIGDIGASAQGFGGNVDTTVGDALSGIGNLINLAGSRKGGSGPSQQDRDNETLKPFYQKVADLQEQRPEIGEAQFQSRLNAAFKSASVGNPALVDDFKNGVVSLTGVEIGDADIDLVSNISQETAKWLTTDPKGIASAPGLFVYNDDGQLNQDLTLLNATRARAQSEADAVALLQLKQTAEFEKATSELNETRQKGSIDEWNKKFYQTALDNVSGLIKSAVSAGATTATSDDILGELRSQRALWEIEINSNAAQGGFQNHPDFSAADALAPYDSLITLVESRQTDLPRLLEHLKSADGITLGKLINSVIPGSTGGYQRAAADYYLENVILSNKAELDAMALGLDPSKIMDSLANKPLFNSEVTPLTGEEGPIKGGSVTEEARVAATALTREERQTEVKAGITNFSAFAKENASDPTYRSTATTAFALAATAINTSGQATGEDVFDKLYNSKFFDTYSTITAFGDENSARLQHDVTENLSTLFNQREKVVRDRISNGFSQLPSFGLTFDGTKIVLGFNQILNKENNDFTRAWEKNLVSALKQRGLTLDLVGIKELAKIDPLVVNAAGLGAASGHLQDVEKDLKYLNKIVGTIAKLPDINKVVAPKIEQRMKFKPVVSTLEEYNAALVNLAEGDEYTVIGTDGKPVTMVRGQEDSLFSSGGKDGQ